MGQGEPIEVVLGFGANIGQPLEQIAEAVELLRPSVDWRAFSSVYRTQPVGYIDQPDFLNLVAQGHTRCTPDQLLARVLETERRLGRERTFRDAPRPIDVDILAYGDWTGESSTLTVPHPRLHLRRFVLEPLVEIAPHWRHPSLGRTAAELLTELPPGERVERVGRLPFRA